MTNCANAFSFYRLRSPTNDQQWTFEKSHKWRLETGNNSSNMLELLVLLPSAKFPFLLETKADRNNYSFASTPFPESA
jgi:hypothetical protein